MTYKLIKYNATFDSILEEQGLALGKNLNRYRGHCYRLLNYINYWRLTEQELKIFEVAIPFHDIGIWTYGTMDYLAVSFEEAKKYVEENELDIDLPLLENMIVNHHKISMVRTNSLAEKLRKSDMVDLTFGIVKFGIPRKAMHTISMEFPNCGFQKDIYSKVFSHAFMNLRNPFPMMKL